MGCIKTLFIFAAILIDKKNTSMETQTQSILPAVLVHQYETIQRNYPNAILLMGLGDYYKVIGRDARKTSGIISHVLTKMEVKPGEFIDMVEIKRNQIESVLSKLIGANYKVALCDEIKSSPKIKRPAREWEKIKHSDQVPVAGMVTAQEYFARTGSHNYTNADIIDGIRKRTFNGFECQGTTFHVNSDWPARFIITDTSTGLIAKTPTVTTYLELSGIALVLKNKGVNLEFNKEGNIIDRW